MATLKVTNIKNESFAGDQLYLKSDGYLGIGTTSPGHKLVISQTNSGGIAAIHLPIDESTILGPNANTYLKMGGNVVLGANGQLDFTTSGTSKLTIKNNGQVAIGSSSTDSSALFSIIKDTTEVLADNEPLWNNASPAFLTVYNSNNTGTGEEAGINIVPAGNANGAISIYGKKTGSYAGDLIFRFRSGASTSAERMRIKSDGDIEVGGNLKTNNITGKNKFINGNFHIWQRGTSSTAGGYVAADRWYHNLSGASMTFSRQAHTDPIDGSRYYARLATTSSDDYCGIRQRIEDAASLPEGKVTVSFWARGHVNGNLAVWGTIHYGTGGSPSSDVDIAEQRTGYLQNDTTFRKYSLTFTIPSHSGKTWGTNNDSYVELAFGQGSGDSASAWTLDISNIQVEIGSIATSFEQRTYGEELALCQRYYQKFTGISYRMFTKNVHRWGVPLPVKMRAAPTATKSYTSTTNYGTDHTGSADGSMLNYSVSTDPSGSDNTIDNAGGTITLDSEL